MKKESPPTYRVGSLREFAEWTRSIVRDPKSANGVPKRWFDSFATAELSDQKVSAIGASRMDARHAHLDDILKE
jgi:hypothetical protein